MTAASIVASAVVFAVATPQGTDFLAYVRDLFTAHGVPVVVVAFVGIVVSEIWRSIVNGYKIARAARAAGVSPASARVRMTNEFVDLY